MATHILLLGRTPFDLDAVRSHIARSDITISTGTSLMETEAAFEAGVVDIVIMGAGIPLLDRLEIVKRVFELSESTSVHMMDRSSGKDGMMSFVNGVLQGLPGESSS
ncbi:MAG: hypothetical protein HKN91_17035 [Acidimicrobiia bacterium]|nr:hypothetical protein [Acidimicrobiia bacterium]